jgi:hypothetical protein
MGTVTYLMLMYVMSQLVYLGRVVNNKKCWSAVVLFLSSCVRISLRSIIFLSCVCVCVFCVCVCVCLCVCRYWLVRKFEFFSE